jgi:hypothetical protein
MTRREWTRNLRDFAKQYEDRWRSFDLRELSPQQDEQYRILGGTLISWLDRHGPALIAERAVLCRLSKQHADPHCVIISGLPGLMAALEIIHPENTRVSVLTEEEYEGFLSTRPDPGYRWHVVFRNTLAVLEDPPMLKRARMQHPVEGGDQYWIHCEESVTGELFARRILHLWRWDGMEYHFLEEAFDGHIS